MLNVERSVKYPNSVREIPLRKEEDPIFIRIWERDPVCGGIINFKDAKGVSIFKHSKYYFCGHNCINAFENNPSAYADKDEEDEFYELSNSAH